MIQNKVSGKAKECFYKRAHKIMIEEKSGVQFWGKAHYRKKEKSKKLKMITFMIQLIVLIINLNFCVF